jgi:hypothetical protein
MDIGDHHTAAVSTFVNPTTGSQITLWNRTMFGPVYWALPGSGRSGCGKRSAGNNKNNSNNKNITRCPNGGCGLPLPCYYGLGWAVLDYTAHFHWIFQSSDELPMLYICLCELYCMANVCTATAVVDDRSSSSSSWLAPFLVVVAMVTTVFYYVYQDLYWVFLVTFAIGSIMTVIGFLRLALFVKRRRPDTLRLFYGAVIAYGVVATPVWILDMVMCDYGVLELANHYWFGMTPHVVWHFCAGYATYCGLLFLTACRCEELGRPFQVDFWCGGLCPVMMASPFSSAAAKQK